MTKSLKTLSESTRTSLLHSIDIDFYIDVPYMPPVDPSDLFERLAAELEALERVLLDLVTRHSLRRISYAFVPYASLSLQLAGSPLLSRDESAHIFRLIPDMFKDLHQHGVQVTRRL